MHSGMEMADTRYLRMTSLNEEFNKYLKDKEEMLELVDGTLKQPRNWIQTCIMVDGILIWNIHASLPHGVLWIIAVFAICHCLNSVMTFKYMFQRLNWLVVVHRGWIRRGILLRAEIDQLLQEVKLDMTENRDRKGCQEQLEALLYRSAKMKPKTMIWYKFRYTWAVIQSFVLDMLVPLVCFYIASTPSAGARMLSFFQRPLEF